ncbi:hypothetical protein [Streptococcus pneumoniae]|nr:hypothetical protein [Streptococcus pneumoniae]
MAAEVLNLQLVSVQVDETDEVDGMRFSTFNYIMLFYFSLVLS